MQSLYIHLIKCNESLVYCTDFNRTDYQPIPIYKIRIKVFSMENEYIEFAYIEKPQWWIHIQCDAKCRNASRTNKSVVFMQFFT